MANSLVVCFYLLLALACHGGVVQAAHSLASSTSAEARQQAVHAIPIEKLDANYRRAVRKVLGDSSIYRRMPTEVIDCDPEMFTFLAQNPEILVEVWKQMGISQVNLERIDDTTFRLADNAGTTGKLTIVEQTCDDHAQNRIVMYAEGAYDGKPFHKPITAQCVLLLRSGSFRETNGRDYVAARLDTFIHIDRASIELFAKAMHPLVGRTADRNFTDTLAFVSNFSQAAAMQPERIDSLVSDLPRISSGRKQRLCQIAYRLDGKSSVADQVEVATDRRPLQQMQK